jgi:2-polyprenyl-3-methyl-5-hydroxy-6-metoxy-1,4-benzoquinol methylase
MSNEKAPQERYLYKPFLGSSHWWALEQCENVGPSTRVLDIGAGSGAIGAELKKRGVTDLTAVEVDAAARQHIAPIYNRVEASFEPLRGGKYELILLLDVLEHMAAPENFLKEVASVLAPRGKILISVPNIAHWSVRFPLLFGIFQYTDRGLLDRTHLQFFTAKRFRKCIEGAGLVMESESASIEPAEFVLPKALWDNNLFTALSKFRVSIAKTFPGLFAYQHLAAVRAMPSW